MPKDKAKMVENATRKARKDQQDLAIMERLGHIRHKVLVMSGKGGVGKSSVAAYLAVALAARGKRVGLMDVDLHGPSIPGLLGIRGRLLPNAVSGKLQPMVSAPNLEVISIDVLTGDRDAATIWRGPLKGGTIRQFISDIDWSELDYMIIDSPPGTGDEPLTVAQSIPDAKALIVTTPQEVALADVRKSINFCRSVKMDILGIVENMSGLVCPECGTPISLFGANGGKQTAEREELALLGVLPIDPLVVEKGDAGNTDFVADETRPWSIAFRKMVEEVESRLNTGLPADSPDRPVVSAGNNQSKKHEMLEVI